MRTEFSLSLLVFLALGACGKGKAPVESAVVPTTVVETEVKEETLDTVPAPPVAPPKPDRAALLQKVNDAVALMTVDSPDAYERALAVLVGVIEVDDSIALAYYNKGVAQHRMGHLGAARMAYETAVDLDPSLAAGWLAVGTLQDEAGSASRAIVKYKEGIKQAPDDVALRVALFGALRRQGRYDEAIQEAKDALKINAKNLQVYNELGLVYLETNQLDMARFVYLKAFAQVEGAENNAAIQCNYGWVLFLRGDPWSAEQKLLAAFELDPGYFPTLVYLSQLYLKNRNFEGALPLLEEAYKQQPKNHGVLLNLGIAYRGVGRFDDSKRMYDLALKLMPDNPDPWLNLGILLGDYLKQYDNSIEAFNNYLNKGGAKREEVQGYIAKVERERERAKKKSKQDAARKEREAKRAERERLLKEAEEKAKNELPEAEDDLGPNDSTETNDDSGDGANPGNEETGGEDSPWGDR